MKAIINIKIYDYKDYIENGFVVFDSEIVEVGEMTYFIDKGYEIIDGLGHILIPNFVCNHAHIYSIFARGLSLPFNPKNFQDILDQMWWKIDSKIDNDITYYSAVAAGYEFLLNGVTTIIDHHASKVDILGSLSSLKKGLVDICNLRSILAFEISDRFNIDEAIKENVDFFENNSSSHCAGLIGLHASSSLSNETLKKVSVAIKDYPIHIHVAESCLDEEDSKTKYNMSIIERLDKYSLLNVDSLLVHGVHLSNDELDILAKKDIYLVVNTTSNMNNGVGLPNVNNFIKKGIPVLVGNDGLNSNMASEYMNYYYTTHLYNLSPTAFSLENVLDSINKSYDYVSRRLNIKLGKIKKGYKADFMLVSYSPFTTIDSNNAFGHLFYGVFPNFRPEKVFIDGVKMVENYKVVHNILLEEFKSCREYSTILWNKVRKD